MDILSVRKKAQAAREAAARAHESSTSSLPLPSPTPPVSTLPTAAAEAQASMSPPSAASTLPTAAPTAAAEPQASMSPPSVASTLPTAAPTAAAAVQAPTALPASVSTLPSTATTPPREARAAPVAADPLHGFLAVDDRDGEDEDDEPRADFVEQGQRFLAFRIGVEEYAATIMDIKEILPVRSVTEVPRAPPGVLGVVSRRGVVLPLVDLGASLGLRETDRATHPQQRVLVAGDGDRACGLRVDAVSEVVRLLPASIEPVPASLGQRNAGLLVGLGRAGGRLFILLDVRAVLDALAASVGLAAQPRTERLP